MNNNFVFSQNARSKTAAANLWHCQRVLQLVDFADKAYADRIKTKGHSESQA